MKKLILAVLAVVLGLIAYLAFWPVPVSPVAWDAPINKGYVGDFAPNTRLANLELIDLAGFHGPEDIAIKDGAAYVSTQSGAILRIDLASLDVSEFAQTGGVPLGLEFDGAGNLIVADAYRGLISVSPDGAASVLTDTVDGTPILYADDLDIGADGVIYFSDASTKFGAEAAASTMAASLLEIMEHGRTGRLLAFDPATSETRIVAEGFSFSNGVAIHADGDVLLVETGEYRVLKINPETGAQTVFIDNLPGFPDNINRGPDGGFIVGLISVRSDWLDENAGNVFMRKLAMRLPPALRPKAVPYGHLVHLSEEGSVLQTWQDPSGSYIDATGGIIHNGYLYVSSLHAHELGRKKLNSFIIRED